MLYDSGIDNTSVCSLETESNDIIDCNISGDICDINLHDSEFDANTCEIHLSVINDDIDHVECKQECEDDCVNDCCNVIDIQNTLEVKPDDCKNVIDIQSTLEVKPNFDHSHVGYNNNVEVYEHLFKGNTCTVNGNVKGNTCTFVTAQVPPNLTPPICNWPPVSEMDVEHLLLTHKLVVESGVPNFLDCRIPVYSTFHMHEWSFLLQDYHDNIICEFLEYGWPIGYECKKMPANDPRNHSRAHKFPHHVDKFICKEVELGATIGPFVENPFHSNIVISPLNTVEKKESEERRVILDLSWPIGQSVNEGIDKHNYLGEQIQVTYPTIDTLCQMVLNKGKGCLLYKKDLKRAYRQLPIDPGDIHMLGYSWRELIFVDRVAPFGLRSAAMICQRTTSAILHIFNNLDFTACNYLDDFMGVDTVSRAHLAFETLGKLFTKLGIQESVEKSCSPDTIMLFLGVLFNSDSLTIEVDPAKIVELSKILPQWLDKVTATRQQLQSIIGKLNFIAKCVRPGRIFISRMLSLLRSMDNCTNHVFITEEFKKDIIWWLTYLPQFNGISMIPDTNFTAPDAVFSCDACITGCGGIRLVKDSVLYFHTEFPDFIQALKLHINALELLTIIVACKLWGSEWSGKSINIYCDNMASVIVINSGRSRDKFMLQCLRELCYISAIGQFKIRAIHLNTKQNRPADILSRWHLDVKNPQEFKHRFKDFELVHHTVPENQFKFSHTW